MNGLDTHIERWLERFPDWDLNDANDLGSTALHLAVSYGTNKLATVQVLLRAGADRTVRDKTGALALHRAAQNADADPMIIGALVSGIRPEDPGGINAAQRSVQRASQVKPTSALPARRFSAFFFFTAAAFITAALSAAAVSAAAFSAFAVSAAAFAAAAFCTAALSAAALSPCLECCPAPGTAFGAGGGGDQPREPTPNEGMTALHHAAKRGDLELCTTCLRLGALPELCNELGMTPLDVARKALGSTRTGGKAPKALEALLVS